LTHGGRFIVDTIDCGARTAENAFSRASAKPGHMGLLGVDLRDVFVRLLAYFGKQGWWPAESPLEVILGAILVQRTTWRNAEMSIHSLRQRGLIDADALSKTSLERLERLLRSSGFYKRKAQTILGFASFLVLNYGGSLEALFAKSTLSLRGELLSVDGIGPETADSILLYAADRPVFPTDAYTRRVLQRLGLPDAQTLPYEKVQDAVHEAFPASVEELKELRALMVKLGKTYCGQEPRCEECPLNSLCGYGRRARGAP